MKALLILFSFQLSSLTPLYAVTVAPPERHPVETSRPAPIDLEIRAGESVNQDYLYSSYGAAWDISDAYEVLMRYRSTDMTNYYVITGAVVTATNGHVRIPWTPAAEGHTNKYVYHIACKATNDTLLRAYGKITIKDDGVIPIGSTGTVPVAKTIIDWSTTDQQNIGDSGFTVSSDTWGGSSQEVWSAINTVSQRVDLVESWPTSSWDQASSVAALSNALDSVAFDGEADPTVSAAVAALSNALDSVAFDGDGSDLIFDASGMTGNLSTDDDTLQELAGVVDGLSTGGVASFVFGTWGFAYGSGATTNNNIAPVLSRTTTSGTNFYGQGFSRDSATLHDGVYQAQAVEGTTGAQTRYLDYWSPDSTSATNCKIKLQVFEDGNASALYDSGDLSVTAVDAKDTLTITYTNTQAKTFWSMYGYSQLSNAIYFDANVREAE